jgi:integrase
VADLRFVKEGVVFTLRRSKTDQAGEGREVAGELHATRSLGRDVARLVQRLVGKAGLEGDFAAHSLRAGFVTAAERRGVSEANVQRVTGHKSVAILRGYVRRANLFEDAPQLTIVR